MLWYDNGYMKTIRISDIANNIDEKVKLSGWVDSVRDQKAVAFIILRDGNHNKIQLVHKKGTSKLDKTISALTAESTIEVTGIPNQ